MTPPIPLPADLLNIDPDRLPSACEDVAMKLLFPERRTSLDAGETLQLRILTKVLLSVMEGKRTAKPRKTYRRKK